jgi:hypothetical protein
VPRIDDGSAETGPGRRLSTAWVTLTVEEAHDLLEALKVWAEERDLQWHKHITDTDGTELTIAINPRHDA